MTVTDKRLNWITLFTLLAAFLLTLLSHQYVFAQSQDRVKENLPSKSSVIAYDDAIQELLTSLLQNEDKEQREEIHKQLRTISGPRFERLIPQLILLEMDAEAKAKARIGDSRENERQAWLGTILIERLKIPKQDIVFALIPYLGKGDPKVENMVSEWLKRHADRDSFESYIRVEVQKGNEPPRALVDFLYERVPGLGILAILHGSSKRLTIEEAKAILWAEHQVSDVLWQWQYGFMSKHEVHQTARDALSELAQHPQWWARLYVAEVMRQHSPFQTDELITLLATDPDESVRSAILSVLGNIGDENNDDKREEQIEEETNPVPN